MSGSRQALSWEGSASLSGLRNSPLQYYSFVSWVASDSSGPLLGELGVRDDDALEEVVVALSRHILGEYGDAEAHPLAAQRITEATKAARTGEAARDRVVRAMLILVSAPERQLC